MQRDWKETPYNWTLQFIRLPQKSEELDAQVQIVNWMEAGIVKAEELISHMLDLDCIIEAFRMIAEKLTNN